MSTKSEILAILSENMGKYISGQEIADKLSLSRNAIWKAIENLKSDGYPVESKSKVGYALTCDVDILSKDVIASGLNYDGDLIVQSSVASTNLVAKEKFNHQKPLLVVANAQTKGRGRLGRDFYSPADTGIYMSYAFRPNFDMSKSTLITLAAAVAVAQSMEEIVKISPKIKWVNDLFINDKKVAGILTEASINLESGQMDTIIVGIGINCFTKDFPDFERNVAGSIDAKEQYSRNQLIISIANKLNNLLENLDPKEVVFQYKTRCNTLGKQITIYRDYNNPNEVGVKARAYDIDDNGGLIVEYQSDFRSQLHTITSGEISIRSE